MDIRPFKPDDARAVVTLHSRAVRQVCQEDYSEKQIESWADQSVKDIRDSAGSERHRFVAEVDGGVVGFGEYHEGKKEVTSLYVDPDWIGNGVGQELLRRVEDHARGQDINKLVTYSSLTAESFYASHGYKQAERTCYSGLEAVKMIKQLT